MRFLIASDIHGSAYYTKKLINTFEIEGADRLIILGDILYHGPRNELPKEYSPKDVAAMLNPMASRILAVRGNCDADVDQMVLQFPMMAKYALLPVKERLVFITHGHTYNLDNLPPLSKGDILLHGHTHLPTAEERDGIIYMNPGSVSIPKNPEGSSYMILENGVFTWKTIDGNVFKEYEIN